MDHRPRAHLRPATGWMNDPTGPVRWNGSIHLFHQHNPDGGYWARPHWGHLVSEDLVHWQRRPTALSPDDEGPDVDGCYSGCVVVDGDEAVMVYTGARGEVGPSQAQTTCLARSQDRWLDHWEKDPANPVTTAPEDRGLLGFRDPFVWREAGCWWQMLGAGSPGLGGAALLYRSDDLVTWTEVGPLLTGVDLHAVDPEEWTGSMWECPALLRGRDADALLISIHDEDTTSHPLAVVGRLGRARFVPWTIQRIDLGPDLYAPCLLADGDGRAISWAWSWEARTPERQRLDGWAGTLTSPRRLEVYDDRVRVAPLPELTGLRAVSLTPRRITTMDGWLADGVEGDGLDLELDLGPVVDRLELRVRRSPELDEVTTIGIDRDDGRLWLDREQASLDPSARGGRLGGAPSTSLPMNHVRVLLDRSIIEVFVDDEVALTARVYPSRPDSTGVEVVGTPAAIADVSLRAWTLGSIWGDDAPS